MPMYTMPYLHMGTTGATSVTINWPVYEVRSTTASNSCTYCDDGGWRVTDNCTGGWGHYVRGVPEITVRRVYNYTDAASVTSSYNYCDLGTANVTYNWGTGATWQVISTSKSSYNWGNSVVQSPADRIKEILRSRRMPGIVTNSKPVGHTIDGREMRARETLHRVIGDEKYNRFLKQGWVSVKARSGLVYRIYPGHGITEVYDRGVMKDRLCVVLNGQFPPTDSLIIRYLLILNNERLFREKAVKHSVSTPSRRVKVAVEQRPLIEIAREIKGTYQKVG